MDDDYIKLIFGLKLKQIRTDRELSLFGLSKLTGLSKSYLNEIENGKKYPKPDKVALLAEKLDIPYDQMVSLKLDKNLAPVGEILKSGLLKELPAELFGIKESQLIDIVAAAPAKVTAFISTIIKISQNYEFSRESFYLASVRSFQEANNNYFKHLEDAVDQFRKQYQITGKHDLTGKELETLLKEELNYKIEELKSDEPAVRDALRSVFIPKSKTLLLREDLDEAQRTFIYAKEAAYHFLNIEERLFTFPWINFNTFDEVLNNYYASYFAGALVVPRNNLIGVMQDFLDKKDPDLKMLSDAISAFNASPESFFQRLTNILPEAFSIKNLFFLRFGLKKGDTDFELNKELHLQQQHAPRGNGIYEHYCRRWVSLQALKKLESNDQETIYDIQISQFVETGQEYLILAAAARDPFKPDNYRCVTLGLLINTHLKRKVKFLNSKTIERVEVGVTCERCPIEDCKVRAVDNVILKKQQRNQVLQDFVSGLIEE
jgi:predicted transcriptional regulator